VIDDSVTNCKAAETSLTWNVTGPPGPPGPAGSDSTRTVFGAVNGNGTSQFATDDFGVERLGAGGPVMDPADLQRHYRARDCDPTGPCPVRHIGPIGTLLGTPRTGSFRMGIRPLRSGLAP
jgi:hypothetical protein